MIVPFSYQEKEINVLGSRFIAILVPMDDFSKIDSILEEIEEKYPKATHYPYAARVTPYEKASDDGEPSHSTGIPLLSLLTQKEIDHALLCVVRYFGGTKLGLSRLTRTYREAAALLIEEGVFAKEIELASKRIELSYSDFEYLKRKIKDQEIEIKDIKYEISVTISLEGNDKIILTALENFPNAKVLEEKTIVTKRRISND